MLPKTGRDCKLYYNTGTVATPVWTEIDEVADVSVDGLERSIAELKRRAKQFTKGLAGLIGMITAGFTLQHGLKPAVFGALITLFFDGTPKEWLIANGDVTVDGTQGLRCPFILSSFPWNQPLEDVSGHECKLSGAYMEDEADDEVDPEWYVVAGT